MMTQKNDSSYAYNKLIAMDVPADIAERVQLMRDDEPGLNGEMRSTIEFTYEREKRGFKRRASAAAVNGSNSSIDDMLEDTDRIATFIEMGMRATPQAQRIALPQWILDASSAADTEKRMSEARALARQSRDQQED